MDIRAALHTALGERYVIEREPGGGMSRVFLATDVTLGRRIALKALSADIMAGASAERFRREVMLLASLQHPHIVPVLDGGVANGLAYFTMPFEEGESLRHRITRDGGSGTRGASHNHCGAG